MRDIVIRDVKRDDIELIDGSTMITLRGAQQGPTVGLLGGVHGDEDEGVLAVRRVLAEIAKQRLAGTVRAVAPANFSAWGAQSRTSRTDGADLARCFAGRSELGPTAALAAELAERVIDSADLLIDLHSAGLQYDMPLFCGFVNKGVTAERSRRAACAFGAPLIWAHPHVSAGRSLSAAAHQGVPAIYAECAGGGGIRAADLDAYVGGVRAILGDLGMLPPLRGRGKAEASEWVYGDGDLDRGVVAQQCGFFVSTAKAGALVEEGTEIGRLYDYEGLLVNRVLAFRAGVVMFLRRQTRTQAGDVLFVLAQPGEGPD